MMGCLRAREHTLGDDVDLEGGATHGAMIAFVTADRPTYRRMILATCSSSHPNDLGNDGLRQPRGVEAGRCGAPKIVEM